MSRLLGKLESVELREAWTSEAGEFTPWLASEENLALLGEVIGLELECEAQEQSVGPFRADILCRDTAAGDWVLIENQLERTDHTHLGQVMTYAAGLKAVTVVWIARRFTEEHRATLDWLNEITDRRYNFFGLEVELWRIGDSAAAPKFNVVSQPNDWSRTVVGPTELSETQTLYLEYWQAFKDHLEQAKSSIRIGTPQPAAWMTFPVGRSNFCISASLTRQKRSGWVQLVVYGDHHVAYFRLLQQNRERIESEIGEALQWRELPDGRESHIRLEFKDLEVVNRQDWPRQHQWFQQTIERFTACFRERVKRLDLVDVDESEEPDSDH